MNILLDAMGGDNAPDANIKGALKAVNQIKATITLVGKEEVIRNKVKEFTGKKIEEVSDRLKIKNATETIEMLETMIYQLMKDATLEELKEAGLDSHYAEHAKALFPTDSNGVPFTTTYFATTGDPLADIAEDMAAEQKARAVYENLIDLTDDPNVIGPLLWLRQREIIHLHMV